MSDEPSPVRRCANIKSRKAPDVQCSLNATYGDYCSRHWKHPHRFVSREIILREGPYTRSIHTAATRIRAWWLKRVGPKKAAQQGLGVHARSQSCNDTELFSLEPIKTIPPLYYFSLTGSNHTLWSFDIRSLAQIILRSAARENPYTREPFSDATLAKIHARLAWLRQRKYSILYPQGTSDLTAEQLWRQKVLDIFMRIESFGFHVSSDWFHGLSIQGHMDFYSFLFSLWYSRLGLTMQQREAIVPGCESPARQLFRFKPASTQRHSQQWWERCNFAVIEALVTRSQDKEQQRLGAMYVIMGLSEVCEEAAEAFPWLD